EAHPVWTVAVAHLFNLEDLAQSTRRDQAARACGLRIAAHLRADLHDPVRFLYHIVGANQLAHIHRQRLLDINVLAGLNRLNEHGAVLEVGRADDHGVDILARQHLGQVRRGERIFAGELLHIGRGLLALLAPGVADGDDVNRSVVFNLDQFLEQAATAAADVRYPDPVIGSQNVGVAGRRQPGHEGSALDAVVHGAILPRFLTRAASPSIAGSPRSIAPRTAASPAPIRNAASRAPAPRPAVRKPPGPRCTDARHPPPVPPAPR